MKRLLLLSVAGSLLGAPSVKAEDPTIIDSPVYEGLKQTAVSIGRSDKWAARNATFKDNSAAWGGGIGNSGYLYLYGNNTFENNFSDWGGGAIDQNGIATLTGNNTFIGNRSFNRGGAIHSTWYTIIKPGDEPGKTVFRDNRASAGGAIATMAATLYVDNAEFVNNRAEDTRNNTGVLTHNQGGAVFAAGNNNYFLNSVFRENHAYAGGAILTGFAQGLIGPDTAFEGLSLYNTSFYDNKAIDKGGALAVIDATIIAAGENGISEFKGNGLDNGKNEAIYMTNEHISGAESITPTLVFKTFNGGKIIMHDDIYGNDYDVDVFGGVSNNLTAEVLYGSIAKEVGNVLAGVSGEGNGEFYLYGTINGAANFNARSGATVHLGRDAEINTKNYKSENAILKLDISVDADNRQVQNGVIKISGDVEGTTQVIVNADSPKVYDGAATLFVSAPNDDAATASAFDVVRVIGSPYMWNSVSNYGGETAGNHWYLTLTDQKNPDYTEENPGDDNKPGEDNKPSGDNNKPNVQYTPEIAAFAGLHGIAVEQNRSVADSVAKGLSFAKNIDCCSTTTEKQAWINITRENANIKAPADMDAKINGVTAGMDIYGNGANRVGIFGAYRRGKYDLSGKGDFPSALESDVRNKSWLGGLYFKRHCDAWHALAMIFAGKQSMDIRTEDHAASADTDALQYGLSARLGKAVALGKRLSVIPEAGVFYTAIDIDRLHDNVGKGADYDVMHYFEAELGAKLEYRFCEKDCIKRVYFEPSLIQTYADGNHTRLLSRSGTMDVKSYKNQTLGRMELGGDLGLNSKFSGYARTGYTFGDNYTAYDFMLGLNYKF